MQLPIFHVYSVKIMSKNEQFQAEVVAGIQTPGSEQAAQVFSRLLSLVEKLEGSAKDSGKALVEAFQAGKQPEELASKIRILQRELKFLGTVGKGADLFKNDQVTAINNINRAINAAARAYDEMRQSAALQRYELGLEAKTVREAASSMQILEKNLKAVDLALQNNTGNKALLDKKKLLSDNKALLEIVIKDLKQQGEQEKLNEAIAKANWNSAKARFAEVARITQQRKESEGSGSAQRRVDRARLDYSQQGRDYSALQSRLEYARVNQSLMPGREEIAMQRLQEQASKDYLRQAYTSAGVALPTITATLRDGPKVKALVAEIKEIEARIIADRSRGQIDLKQEAALLENVRSKMVQIENVRHDHNLNDPERVAARRDAQAKNMLSRASGEGGASLLAVQASLMANYAILNSTVGAMQAAVRTSVELEAAFRNVQAVTGTSKAEMTGLEERIKSVAASSRFSAIEVADAALALGQAGLSARQVGEALQPVVMLASAAGTNIAQAVDLITSVVGVFDKGIGDIADVANKVTQAANSSKISVEKMALGLQYAGNAASQIGVTFEEVTAAMAAMSNAGIKNGSTLGTGLRQFLTELQKPSEEFIASLQRVGLSMNDIDVRSNGLIGVVQRLREAGFVASDAIKSFDVRGASAFNALIANPEEMERQFRLLMNTKAGIEANEIQMDSLQAQTKRATTALGNLASSGFEPLSRVLASTLSGFATLTQAISEHNIVVGAAGTALASMLAMGAASHLSSMAAGALKLASGAGAASTAVIALSNANKAGSMGQLAAGLAAAVSNIGAITPAATAATASTLTLRGAVTGLTAAFSGLSIVSGIGIAIGALTAAYYAYDAISSRTVKTIEEMKAKTNESKGAFEEKDAQVKSLTHKIDDLMYREQQLRSNSEALKNESLALASQFGAVGYEADKNNVSFETMIGKLRDLKTAMAEVRKQNLLTALADNEALMRKQAEKLQDTLDTRQGTFANRALRLEELAGSKANLKMTAQERQMLLNAKAQLTAGNPSDMGDVTNAQLIVQRLIPQITARAASAPLSTKGYDTYLQGVAENLVKDLGQISKDLTDLKNTEAENARLKGVTAKDAAYKAFNESGTFGVNKGKPLTFEEAMPSSANLTALARSGMSKEDARDPMKVFEGVKKIQEERSKVYETLLKKIELAEDAGLRKEKGGITEDTAATFRAMVNARAEKEKNEVIQQANATETEATARYEQTKRLLESRKKNARTNKDKTAEKAIEDELAALEIENKNRSETSPAKAALTAARIKAIHDQNKENIDDRTGRVFDPNGSASERAFRVRAEAFDLQADELKNSTKTAQSMEELNKIIDAAIEAKIKAKTERINALKKKHELEAKQPGFNNEGKFAQNVEMTAAIAAENSKINSFASSFTGLLESAMERLDTLTKTITEQKRKISEIKWKGEDRVFEAEQALRDLDLQMALGKRTRKGGLVSSTVYGPESSGIEETRLANGKVRERYAAPEAFTRFGPNGVMVDNRGTGSSRTIADIDAAAVTPAAVSGAIRETLNQRRNRLVVEAATVALDENEKLLKEYGDDTTGVIGNMNKAYQSAKEAVKVLRERLANATSEIEQVRIQGELSTAEKRETETFRDLRQAKGERNQLRVEDHNLRKRVQESTDALPQETNLDNLLNKLGDVWDEYARTVGQMDVIKTIGDGLAGVLGNLTGQLGNAFASIVTGTKSVKDAFKDMAVSVIQAMIQIIAQALAMAAIKMMLRSMGMEIPMATGGEIIPGGAVLSGVKKMASGGPITGGIPNRDSVPIMAMPGEFMLNKRAVDAVGTDFLHSLNSNANSVASSASPKVPKQGPSEGGGVVNVWVVSPDQKPSGLGPRDVVAVVADDINRGGTIKQLVKQVQLGQ